jgi:hypothetical protein
LATFNTKKINQSEWLYAFKEYAAAILKIDNSQLKWTSHIHYCRIWNMFCTRYLIRCVIKKMIKKTKIISCLLRTFSVLFSAEIQTMISQNI